jgi:hypothetical protein
MENWWKNLFQQKVSVTSVLYVVNKTVSFCRNKRLLFFQQKMLSFYTTWTVPFSMDSMLCSIRGTYVSHYLVQYLWNSESDSSESLGGDKMREGESERTGAYFTCTKHLPSLAMSHCNISSTCSILVYSCVGGC